MFKVNNKDNEHVIAGWVTYKHIWNTLISDSQSNDQK